MKVWLLMIDDGFDYEPDVGVWGVYATEAAAGAEKYEAENENPDARFWIEEWEVK